MDVDVKKALLTRVGWEGVSGAQAHISTSNVDWRPGQPQGGALVGQVAIPKALRLKHIAHLAVAVPLHPAEGPGYHVARFTSEDWKWHLLENDNLPDMYLVEGRPTTMLREPLYFMPPSLLWPTVQKEIIPVDDEVGCLYRAVQGMAEWIVYNVLEKDEVNVVQRNMLLSQYGTAETAFGEQLFLSNVLPAMHGVRPILDDSYREAVLSPGESPLTVLPWEEAGLTAPVKMFAHLARTRMQAYLALTRSHNPGLGVMLVRHKKALLTAGFSEGALEYTTARTMQKPHITLANIAPITKDTVVQDETYVYLQAVADVATDVARWKIVCRKPGLEVPPSYAGIVEALDKALNQVANNLDRTGNCIAAWGILAQALSRDSRLPLILNGQVQPHIDRVKAEDLHRFQNQMKRLAAGDFEYPTATNRVERLSQLNLRTFDALKTVFLSKFMPPCVRSLVKESHTNHGLHDKDKYLLVQWLVAVQAMGTNNDPEGDAAVSKLLTHFAVGCKPDDRLPPTAGGLIADIGKKLSKSRRKRRTHKDIVYNANEDASPQPGLGGEAAANKKRNQGGWALPGCFFVISKTLELPTEKFITRCPYAELRTTKKDATGASQPDDSACFRECAKRDNVLNPKNGNPLILYHPLDRLLWGAATGDTGGGGHWWDNW
jgi:hypothetical protein